MVDRTLRERKKLRTRRALVDAAVRLFDERGYAETTVAEIAAAAEVSTKTFFNYFPSKEDVLFADAAERMTFTLRLIAARRPGERLPDLLERVMDGMISLVRSDALDVGVSAARVRMRLVTGEPALQARWLQQLWRGQTLIAEALRRVYPGLDEMTAVVCVGAYLGAGQAALLTSLKNGDTPEEALDAAHRAVRMVLRGFAEIDPAG